MKDRLGSDDYRDPNLYDYHYDREERLGKLPSELREKITGRSAKGLFRKNRTLAVILADIGIIVVVWFVFLPLIHAGASGRIQGYAFSLHGFSYAGRALVSLKVVRESEKAQTVPTYTAVFGLSSGNQSVEMQGTLPNSLHGVNVLRTSIPLAAKTVAIICTVKLAGKHLSLKAKLTPES